MPRTQPTPLPLHITPHHLKLSPALRDFTREKLGKVPRFAGDAQAADVVLRRRHGTTDGRHFSASARVAVAGNDFHASATHADLYTAIVMLAGKLARRARKRKTRLARETFPARTKRGRAGHNFQPHRFISSRHASIPTNHSTSELPEAWPPSP